MKPQILNRDFVVRGIFILYLITFIFKYLQGGFMHQFASPLMVYPEINITYWLFLLLKVPQFLTSNIYTAFLCDIILVLSCIGLIIYPNKYTLAIVFTVFNWLNYMAFCMVNVYQPLLPTGMLLVSIPALFKTEFKFLMVFWAIRFWACFLYFEAGVLKFLRGGAFYDHHMVNSIKATLPLTLSQNPYESARLSLKYFFIENPMFSQTIFILVCLLEVAFIIGFFTRKYDWLLLTLFLVFHIANQYLLDMFFMNSQILLICCFLPWEKLSSNLLPFKRKIVIKDN